MEQKLRQALLRQGYSLMDTNSPNVHIFFRKQEEEVRAILWVKDDKSLPVSPDLLVQLQNKVRACFGRTDLFTIVETWDDERLANAGVHLDQGWIVDGALQRLIVYEYQPADFYGLRDALEEALQSKDQIKVPKRTRTESKVSPVNTALVVINVLVFAVLEILGDTTNSEFMLYHGAMYPECIIVNHEYYRFFTEMFIHFGVLHLFNNMMVLFFLGDTVERAMGKIRYLMVYLLSGLCGSVLSYVMMINTGDWAVSGGASGAIFGMIGALLAVVVKNRGQVERITLRRVLFMIVLSLYMGFTSVGVDNYAHLGGLLSGFIMTMLVYHRQRNV